jgi:hypothetical protein
LAKGRNALATGEKAEITEQDFNELYPYKKEEIYVSDGRYEWHGRYYTLEDGRIVREYKHDTGGVSYEFVDKIPDPRAAPDNWFSKALKWTWDFFTEDIATIFDPEASAGEKVFALAMFIPVAKPIKLLDKATGGFAVKGVKLIEGLGESKSVVKKGSVDSKYNTLKDHTIRDIKDTNEGSNAEDVIAKRVKDFDLSEHPIPYKQLSSKKMKALKLKVENRTITKEEYKSYIWNKKFAKRRDKGVVEYWKQERIRISNGENPTRNWPSNQIEDILIKKRPKFNGQTLQGHHTYSAAKYPHLANKGEVIYPLTYREHFYGWHGGNYKNSSPGKPIKEIIDF